MRQLLCKADIKDIELKEALWELAFNVYSRTQKQDNDRAVADITYKELSETLEKEQFYHYKSNPSVFINFFPVSRSFVCIATYY